MAPEHLHLQVREPMALLPLIRNAGAILLGDSTAAALGGLCRRPIPHPSHRRMRPLRLAFIGRHLHETNQRPFF